jgi:hypothetical protein
VALEVDHFFFQFSSYSEGISIFFSIFSLLFYSKGTDICFNIFFLLHKIQEMKGDQYCTLIQWYAYTAQGRRKLSKRMSNFKTSV